MRSYLSFPRAARTPSPRILFYGSDERSAALRDLAVAAALTLEFPGGSLVLATGALEAPTWASPQRVEIVKLPGLTASAPSRPLARERIRRMRQRMLSTLFDVFLPDLLLIDSDGAEAEHEAHLLVARARALEAATLVGVAHDGPEESCHASPRFREEEPASACPECQHRIRRAAREALARLPRLGGTG